MPTEPLTVAVLMGGKATEHDVSIKSGTVVANALDRTKYRVLPVQIGRDGRWLLPESHLAGDGKWLPRAEGDDVGARSDALVPSQEIVSRGIDVAYVALHGRYGEDGCIQGLLEILDLPYTGSGVLASALAMDKVRAKTLVAANGITTPAWMLVKSEEWARGRPSLLKTVAADFGYPCVAKVPEEGSSFGMGIPSDPDELAALMDEHIGVRGHMMIEEYIDGTEITSSVLGGMPGENPRALPITEIVPKSSAYFDFEAKYTPGATEEITPARLDDGLTARAQEIGVRVHGILGCGTLSRTDMIVRGDEIFYLETNTIPGMTDTSLFPQAAAAVGISFPEFLDIQIELAMAQRLK
jgi:D-alanine-D-alanine ligase